MKLHSLFLSAVVLFAFVVVLLAGCRLKGKIPVDEQRARQHVISAATGREYTNFYRQGKVLLERQLGDSFLNRSFDLPNAESFNRDAIALLLNQQGAEGIRIYLGRDKEGQIRFVLVPVDKDGKDIIKRLLTERTAYIPGVPAAYAGDTGGAQVIEMGQRCPTLCDLESTLAASN